MLEDIQIWFLVTFWTTLLKIRPIRRIWIGLKLVELMELADGDTEHLLGVQTLTGMYMNMLSP